MKGNCNYTSNPGKGRSGKSELLKCKAEQHDSLERRPLRPRRACTACKVTSGERSAQGQRRGPGPARSTCPGRAGARGGAGLAAGRGGSRRPARRLPSATPREHPLRPPPAAPSPGHPDRAPPAVCTFTLGRVLTPVPEDVDLVDGSVRLEKFFQLLLRPGPGDLPHKHLNGIWVWLV